MKISTRSSPRSGKPRQVPRLMAPRQISRGAELAARGWPQGAQIHVPVNVLVEQIAEATGTAGIAGLRAEGTQPHVVAGLDLDPVLVQPVHGLAFQNIEPVLHHM